MNLFKSASYFSLFICLLPLLWWIKISNTVLALDGWAVTYMVQRRSAWICRYPCSVLVLASLYKSVPHVTTHTEHQFHICVMSTYATHIWETMQADICRWYTEEIMSLTARQNVGAITRLGRGSWGGHIMSTGSYSNTDNFLAGDGQAYISLLAVITRPPDGVRRSLLGACGASPRYSSWNYPSSGRSFVSVRQVSPPPSSGRSLSSVRQVSLSRSVPGVS